MGTVFAVSFAGKPLSVGAIAASCLAFVCSTTALAQPCAPSWTFFTDSTGPNQYVRSLTLHNGALYARGEATATAGLSAKNVSQFDGVSWSGAVASGWPYSGANAGIGGLNSYQGRLYAPLGNATVVVGYEVGAVRDGTPGTWAPWPKTGLFDSGAPVNINRGKIAATHNGSLYVAGTFFHPDGSGGSIRRRFASFGGASWSMISGGYGPTITTNDANTVINAMVSEAGDLYVGGIFATLRHGELSGGGATTSASNIARYSGGAWASLPNGGLNGTVYCMAVYDGDLYVGGDFTATFDGTVALSRIARLHAGAWLPVGGGMSGSRPRSMAVADDGRGRALFIGATSGVANNAPTPTSDTTDVAGVVRWNGSRYSTLATGITGGSAVFALARLDAGFGEGLVVGADSIATPSGTGRTARFGPAPMLDTDGDGIYDTWETDGIDGDCDGTIDLVLPGASPTHRDIYLEVDAMNGRDLLDDAVTRVVNAFEDAPVDNPVGGTGIHLHILRDETGIARQSFPNGATDLSAFKRLHFGTPTDRTNPTNSKAILDAKRRVYRYCVMGDYHSGTLSSGLSELPGDEFTVTLGAVGGGNSNFQAATLMHELGHTLGLFHGGHQIDWTKDTRYNFKPNYLSIMNYAWQFAFARTGWQLDYSRTALASLNEAALVESAGLVTPFAASLMVGPLPVRFINAAVPMDWDGSTSIELPPTTVAADLNSVKPGQSSPGDVLDGSNDWPRLIYNFRTTLGYAEGAGAITTEVIDAESTPDLEALTNPPASCPCVADFDQSGGTPDAGDVDAFFASWLLGDAAADADCSGGTPDAGDVDAFFAEWLAGGC